MSNKGSVLYITCYCGIARLLPDDVKGEEGEKITLQACPKCGASFSGVYRDGRIIVEV